MPDTVYEWLTESESRTWLDFISAELAKGKKEISLQKKLREELSAEKVRALFQLTALRQRGKQKFPLADRMFFTDESLQQASSLRLAEAKSKRFPKQSTIEDWCCGIGGDLLGLASVTEQISGLDLNPELVQFAQANLQASYSHGTVNVGDVSQREVRTNSFYHVDPARRQNGRRTTQLEHYQPGIEVIERVVFESQGACIKLAPATEPYVDWDDRCEWQWIGHRGECKQLVCWSGELARHKGKRTALVVESEKEHELVESAHDRPPQPTTTKVGSHLFEPQSCLTVSNLVPSLAVEFGFQLLNASPIFVTADKPIHSPFTQAFEILEECSANESKILAALKRLNPSEIEFKCRGQFEHLVKLKPKLKKGDGPPLMLIVLQLADRNQAFLCKRLPKAPTI